MSRMRELSPCCLFRLREHANTRSPFFSLARGGLYNRTPRWLGASTILSAMKYPASAPQLLPPIGALPRPLLVPSKQ